MTDLAVVNCREVVTLAGPARPRVGEEMREIGVVADGAIRVRGGKVAAIGRRAEIVRGLSPDTEVVDAQGGVLLPGFVDAHTHAVFAGSRVDEFERRALGASYQEIAEAGGGIRSTVRQTRDAGEQVLLEAARRRAEWFLAGGTTTIEVKSGYGLETEAELKMLRVIRALNGERRLRTVATFLGAHVVPDEYRDDPDGYVEELIDEMLPRVAEEQLAEYCDVFCERGAFSAKQARAVLEAARSYGMGLRVHADQFTADAGSVVAAESGASTADHLECTTEAGIAALARAQVQPVLLPGSVYALGGRRYANARAMIEAGLAVVVATDLNPGSSPTASMPLMLSMACTQMGMTPAEAITAATVNAAYSLGRGSDAGSLEPGRAADFAIHDCADHRELAYFFGRDTARAVYRGGVCVFRRRNE